MARSDTLRQNSAGSAWVFARTSPPAPSVGQRLAAERPSYTKGPHPFRDAALVGMRRAESSGDAPRSREERGRVDQLVTELLTTAASPMQEAPGAAIVAEHPCVLDQRVRLACSGDASPTHHGRAKRS